MLRQCRLCYMPSVFEGGRRTPARRNSMHICIRYLEHIRSVMFGGLGCWEQRKNTRKHFGALCLKARIVFSVKEVRKCAMFTTPLCNLNSCNRISLGFTTNLFFSVTQESTSAEQRPSLASQQIWFASCWNVKTGSLSCQSGTGQTRAGSLAHVPADAKGSVP